VICARNGDFTCFNRLAQCVEHAWFEFRKLVEKQHTVMRERNFAGPDAQASANQRRHAGRMMRRAKWPPIGESAAFNLAGDGGDHGDFEKFGWRERRQD